jgi:glycosyltransferase involved in cell wall biosynthesis
MLSWEYPPNVVGGLGKHVAELIPALARHGVEVHLITIGRGSVQELEVHNRCVIHRIGAPSPSVAYPDFFTEVWEANSALEQAGDAIIRQSGPFQLIHNHDWLTSFSARALKQRHKLPLVGTIHATERGRGRGQLQGEQALRINDAEWWLTYDSWRVICCTHYMADELRAYFSTPKDKMDVIPNGVDPAPFQALEGIGLADFRARFASPEQKVVLYVGRIVAEKGIGVLLRSVPLVLAKVPLARFVVAGTGPERERMLGLVRDLALADRVLLPGFVSDAERNRLYKVADCAVFPSLYEPFGIVALEAMAAKAPVVVSETGGLREVVRHGETGITIYPNSPESCAWGIIHTLAHPEWARQRAENAYREVLTVYNWDTIASQTLEVYERVIAERAQAAW